MELKLSYHDSETLLFGVYIIHMYTHTPQLWYLQSNSLTATQTGASSGKEISKQALEGVCEMWVQRQFKVGSEFQRLGLGMVLVERIPQVG